MKLSLEARSPADARADVLIIGRHVDGARPIPELTALDKKLTGLLGESAAELEDIGRSLASRIGERELLVAEFDPELLELYEDLRRQKKGVGAAALVDGVCQGCHQKLSAMELDRLKRTEGVKRCEYCRRILIFT